MILRLRAVPSVEGHGATLTEAIEYLCGNLETDLCAYLPMADDELTGDGRELRDALRALIDVVEP